MSFVVQNGESEEVLSQYFKNANEPIGTMPQDPFVAGKIFEKWVIAEKDDDGNFIVNGQKVMIPFIYKSTDNMMIQMIKQAGGEYSDDNGNILLFNDKTKELLGAHLNTLHNLWFYEHFMADIRQAIAEDRLEQFAEDFYKVWGRPEA